MSVFSMMVDTCTIKRDTNSKGSTSAAPVGTFSSFATGVPCSVQCESADEAFRYDRQTPSRQFTVYFLPGQDVRSSDVIVPSSGTYSGMELRCVGDLEDRSGRGVNLAMRCERIGGVDA